jgi:hypothetical protein
MHLTPTAGFQKSLIYFLWDIYRDPPLHNFFSNIKVDILKPCCGREVHYPKHLKPTPECQISTLIFEKKNVEGGSL